MEDEFGDTYGKACYLQSRRNFHHEPIDTTKGQIRLMKLNRNLSYDGHLQCELSIVNLSQKPGYKAVSYVWGPSNPVHIIIIGGRQYTIRANLWRFLYMFRLRLQKDDAENDDFLWIDQITIDQSNVSERNHQVQLMTEIFSNAGQVIAWLGWPDPVYVPIKTALEAHSHLDNRHTLTWERCCLAIVDYGHVCPICDRHYHRTQGKALTAVQSPDLLGSPYWTRLWVTQEVVLARKIVFFNGNEQLSPSELRNYCSSFTLAEVDQVMEHIEALLRMRSQYSGRRGEAGYTLMQVFAVINTTSLQCAEPRDLVFGMLGMLRFSERVTVDYSLPAGEVFAMLLDKLMLHPNLPQIQHLTNLHRFYSNLALLGSRLGLPQRWRKWLRITDESPNDITPKLKDFFSCSYKIENYGFSKAGWTPWDLASVIHCLVPYLGSLLSRQDEQWLIQHFDVTIKQKEPHFITQAIASAGRALEAWQRRAVSTHKICRTDLYLSLVEGQLGPTPESREDYPLY